MRNCNQRYQKACINNEMKDYLDSLIINADSGVTLIKYCELMLSKNLLFVQVDKESSVVNQYINYGNVGNQGPSEVVNINMKVRTTNFGNVPFMVCLGTECLPKTERL